MHKVGLLCCAPCFAAGWQERIQENCKTKQHIKGIYLTSLVGQESALANPRRLRPPMGDGTLPHSTAPSESRLRKRLESPGQHQQSKRVIYYFRLEEPTFLSCIYSVLSITMSLHNTITDQDPGDQGVPGQRCHALIATSMSWPAACPGTSDMHLLASLTASAPLPHSSPMQTRSHPFDKLPRTPINKMLLSSPCSEIARWAVHRNGTFSSSSNDFDHAKLHSILAKLTR